MKRTIYYLHGLVYSFISPISVYLSDSGAMILSSPHSIWRMVFFCVFLYILIAISSLAIFRDHSFAGLVSLLFVLAMFYTWPYFVLILSSIILYWISLGVVTKKIEFDSYPHVSALMISIAVSVYFGSKYVQVVVNEIWDETKSMARPVEYLDESINGEQNTPDIYYIVLDGYGGANMLKTLHGFDNSQFISELQDRGFVVPSESRPNYARTIYSLTSSLNMQYLDSVSEKMGASSLWWPLMGTITHGEVRKFLEHQGYETVAVASGFDFTTVTDSDIFSQPYPVFLNEFEEIFIHQTNLSHLTFLGNLGISFPSYETHRRIVLNNFKQLDEIPALDSPKFVFIHILSPHAPFVFDAQGNAITPDYSFSLIDGKGAFSPPAKYQEEYVNAIKYLNIKILEAVDGIMKNSSTPPIIIIQGDHGSGAFIDYHSSANTCMSERFSILNAYYLPDVNGLKVLVPEDITPVNTFRMIFNQYFSTDLEILPDKYYFSTTSAMFQFEDIQDRLEEACDLDQSR